MQSGNKTRARALLNQGLVLFLREAGRFPGTAKPRTASSGTGAFKRKVEQSNRNLFRAKPVLTLPTRQKGGTLIQEAAKGPGKVPSFQAIANKKNLNGVTTIIPENILSTLVENVRPCIEIRKVRVARATYQVPAQISKSKGQSLALRWIIEFAKKRKFSDKISFAEALAQELRLAHKKQGLVRDRRSQLHRLAETNRSYMRYRWW